MGEAMGRYREMVESLRPIGRAVVAFSGGVDSTLLLVAAREALGDSACRHRAEQTVSRAGAC